MRIENGKTALIVVETSWSKRPGIARLLRSGNPDDRSHPEAKEHHITAKVLETKDPRGLWIELHTERRRKDPTKPVYELLIPWGAVLAMLHNPEPEEPDGPEDELERFWNLPSGGKD
jgi:hypothetical protein